MDLREAIAIDLASVDPRRAAEAALRQVLGYVRATAAALFRCSAGRTLTLFAGCGVDQMDLERAAEGWTDCSEPILAGHPFTDETFALVPIGGGPPEGVLYLGDRGPFSLSQIAIDNLRRLGPLLSASLRAATRHEPTSTIDSYLERTPPEEVERQQLFVLLQRHAWNISHVAKLLGVSRVTIYKRMERLRIARSRPLRGEP